MSEHIQFQRGVPLAYENLASIVGYCFKEVKRI